jgi:ABC-type lipoprotein release transport system permease subunit
LSDWRPLAVGAAIVFTLVVALLSTLLAARWALRGRDDDGWDERL